MKQAHNKRKSDGLGVKKEYMIVFEVVMVWKEHKEKVNKKRAKECTLVVKLKFKM